MAVSLGDLSTGEGLVSDRKACETEAREKADHRPLQLEQFRAARLSRDSRFDGQFFVAVKTTGIFCRPICPANLPKEKNVEYFVNAPMALQAGYRPCLRCRPDSAPSSWAWQGVETTFRRAINLIEQGALQQSSVEQLAARLGISSRYLRQVFDKHLGMSPKRYAQFQQIMFAKQLLHCSSMSITDIGFACGFNSTRRFNDAFQKCLKLNPTNVRRQQNVDGMSNVLTLAYRGDYDWQRLLAFYQLRAIDGIERVTERSYERYVELDGTLGWFKIWADFEDKKTVRVEFDVEDARQLYFMVSNIKRMFDLNADLTSIESHLLSVDPNLVRYSGIRLPGVWSTWEAGVRAVLGQQVSVKAAIGQVNLLTDTVNRTVSGQKVFPDPRSVSQHELSFLRMPQSRKETLSRLANALNDDVNLAPDLWAEIKGIGPWTINYAKLRGLSQPNLLLATDLIVKKYTNLHPSCIASRVSPWGSYATLHCWSQHS
ncbi:DNA-3-methyladenine glycosylase 2 family protein [Vibrio methylphosphonaticus]|uniref:DNA-3-methyladenine glycosylase 2 family protein n=1 Tax=Vibrio methylphosphonaticus TaxID=2946866 RepID=UPI00202A3EFF|nr:AlkA N-terminal domain-containing protein [Vibrio methylphosphonaticus]MCL9775344.1 helix-turn-helix domain-containing protein [Vibrio methylphosphonaticus]